MTHNVENILKNFNLPGKLINVTADLTGLINDTYIVTCRDEKDRRFSLQRINIRVFTRPVEVMSNIHIILRHQAEKIKMDKGHPDPERGVLTLVPTIDGKSYYLDPGGEYWRIYHFIDNTKIFNRVETGDQAFEAARMFGRFGRYLSDLDVRKIYYTIPHFHNIVKRYAALEDAINEDIADRKNECKEEIEFAMDHKHLTEPVTDLLQRKEIPVRVTHNDTKINNVLMDEKTEEGLCVIDLDTVMPGTILSDFGDMVRTFTNTLKEDDHHINQVKMRLNIFRALAEGYLKEASDFLLPVEKEHLVYGGKLITLMQGIRNLTDYLMCDVYYKTEYREHNLHRTRNQFALVRSIEDQEGEMAKMVEKLV